MLPLGTNLTADGGRTLGALTEAQDIADNAARAGSQAVDLERWRAEGRPIIDRDRARIEVDDFMVASELADRVESWTIVAPTWLLISSPMIGSPAARKRSASSPA